MAYLFFILLANPEVIHLVNCLIVFSVDSILLNICGKQDVLRFESINTVDAYCVYKCDDIKKPDCGLHGDCVVTYAGDVKCL